MEDLSGTQGATLPITVKVNVSEEPATASILLKKTVGGAAEYNGTASFSNQGIADLTISAEDTDDLDPGEYLYQVTVVYDDGAISKFPGAEDCEGECEFPKLTICEKLG